MASTLGEEEGEEHPRVATRAAPGNRRGPAYHATARRARSGRASASGKGAQAGLTGAEEESDEEAPHEGSRGSGRQPGRDLPKQKKRLPDYKSQSQRAAAAAERRARKADELASVDEPVLD